MNTTHEAGQPKIFTWRELTLIQHLFDQPFQFELDGGEKLLVEKMVRLIPKRRMVVFGSWQGKPVAAKLFLDQRRFAQQARKDASGIQILVNNKIPTPALQYHGMTKDSKVGVLLFERLFSVVSLDTLWEEKSDFEQLYAVLNAVMVELATQHVLGIVQRDLHLKNFLIAGYPVVEDVVTNKSDSLKVYTLDGAQIEQKPARLDKAASMENVALLLSQLGVGYEEWQALLFKRYAKARGWLLKGEDYSELFNGLEKWKMSRWKHYAKKIFRDSTQHAALQTWQSLAVYDRKAAQREFLAFLQDPESVFQPCAHYLKQGNSATVIRVCLDGRDLVIKRYNVKSLWHRLRRACRHTRAWNAWRIAKKMELFGVKTAKPIGILENRLGALRGVSYFVSEYSGDYHAGEYFKQHANNESATLAMVEKIAKLIKNVARIDLTHGDLKITNILVNQAAEPVLIDLDGTEEHYSATLANFHWRRELQRFMRNFDDLEPVAVLFKSELGLR